MPRRGAPRTGDDGRSTPDGGGGIGLPVLDIGNPPRLAAAAGWIVRGGGRRGGPVGACTGSGTGAAEGLTGTATPRDVTGAFGDIQAAAVLAGRCVCWGREGGPGDVSAAMSASATTRADGGAAGVASPSLTARRRTRSA